MRSTSRNLFIGILIIFSTTQVVQSENSPIYIFTGNSTTGPLFGHSVASAGDVNNDGYADLIVGSYVTNQTYVFSGFNRDTLYYFTGIANLGYSVASAGDVNNDGYDDVIIGAPQADRALVFSGLTGDTLFNFSDEAEINFGKSVASAGDVNNDGYADLIVGVPGKDAGDASPGWAYVFSGFNGDTLHLFTGEAALDLFGNSVSSAGDVNNDGYPDLIIGAQGNDAGGAQAGRAYVFSGLDGDTLHVFTSFDKGGFFGWSVASAGDVNNDGHADLIVGAPLSNLVNVYSGLNGDILFGFTGEAENDYFGISVASAGDVNKDGHADLIVGAYGNSEFTGRAYVFSGSDGDTLRVFTGEAVEDGFGFSVASAGDVFNDGYSDLIVGALFNDGGGDRAGRVYVYSGSADGGCCVGATGNADRDIGETVDIADLTYLIDHLFINFPQLACHDEGNVDGDLMGKVDIADLTFLIDHLFINFPLTADCQ